MCICHRIRTVCPDLKCRYYIARDSLFSIVRLAVLTAPYPLFRYALLAHKSNQMGIHHQAGQTDMGSHIVGGKAFMEKLAVPRRICREEKPSYIRRDGNHKRLPVQQNVNLLGRPTEAPECNWSERE